MKTYALTPVDAWFFRDGSPYNAHESNQTSVRSMFPPHPTTVVGALRAALARNNGWDNGPRWNRDVAQWLGDGFEDLGKLSFRGPFLSAAGTVCVPAPLHLVLNDDERTFLAPAEHTRLSDAGDVRLPSLLKPLAGAKPAENHWVSVEQLGAILRGEVPSGALRTSGDLFALERRIGIMRDAETHATGDRAMYSPAYVRLKPGVSLRASVIGLPADKRDPAPLSPFGGEARMAHLEPATALELPAAVAAKRAVVIFLTPGFIGREHDGVVTWPGAGDSLPGLDVNIVSACVGKTVHIGGWDFAKRQPRPLQPAVPAGTVFFVECDDAERLAQLHNTCIGQQSNYGFGHIVIGRWPEEG